MRPSWKAGGALWLVACAPATVVSSPSPMPRPMVAVAAEELPPPTPLPPPPAEDPFDPVQPATTHLDRAVSVTRRAHLAMYAGLFAEEPREGVLPLSQESPREARGGTVAVVEVRPTALRILVDVEGVHLVAYQRREAFRETVRERVRASRKPTGAQPEGEDGIWVQPGMLPEAGSGRRRKVRVDDRLFEGDLWVDADAIGRFYEVPEVPGEEDRRLAPATTIQTADGAALLTTPGDGESLVQTLPGGEGPSGFRRVRYVSPRLWVEGWVPAAALRPIPDGGGWGGGGGTAAGWGVTDVAMRQLHAGDALHAGPGGEVVGRVVDRRVRVIQHRCDDAGCAVGVHLGGWGFVDLWITAGDAAFGDRWEQAFFDRVKMQAAPSNGKLPWTVTHGRDEVAACWLEATEAGAKRPVRLKLLWDRHDRVTLLPGPGGAALRSCVADVFSYLPGGPRPTLPLPFSITLTPIPMPER